jgi:peptidoglycan hydrolase-like protein with peptidoglycan-binding domain
MEEGLARTRAELNTRRRRRRARIEGRPDRVALWAVFLGIFATVAGAASADAASSGGTGDGAGGIAGTGGSAATGTCQQLELGQRPLRLGDCGTDVETLNWILRSKPYGSAVPLDQTFGEGTEAAVRAFQEAAQLHPSGVVESSTRKALKRSMNKGVASWYGPGFFGNRTACGETLERGTVGVAHKSLPCGTRVTFYANGHYLRAEVIDRGPYSRGINWDLTQAAARALGLELTENVRAAVAG